MPKTRFSFSLTSAPVTEVGVSNGSHIYPHQATVAEYTPLMCNLGVKKSINEREKNLPKLNITK